MFADRTNWNLAGNRLSEALARHRAGGKRLLDLTGVAERLQLVDTPEEVVSGG